MPWTKFRKAKGRSIPFMVVQLYSRGEKEKTNIVSMSPPKGDQRGAVPAIGAHARCPDHRAGAD